MTKASETGMARDRSLLFEYPSFLRFCLIRGGAMAANQMMLVAIGWQIYSLTGSAYDLGLVGLCQFLPSLVLVLVVGQVVDRYDRRHILAACVAVQLLLGLGLAMGSGGNWLTREIIFSAAIILGVAKAFQVPTQQALCPLLVPVEVLPRAFAISSGMVQTGIVAGPAIGGLLYVFGAQTVYFVCGGLFFVSFILALCIRMDHTPAAPLPLTLPSILAGLSFVWNRKETLGAISLDLFAVLFGGATALLPIFAKDILEVGPLGLGLLRSAPAAGAVIMSVYIARHSIRKRVGKALFASVAMYGVAMCVFALSTSFYLSLAVLAIAGAFDMLSVVIRQSLVQLNTPNEMRGRVGAVNSIFVGASNELGEFESGVTAAWFGAAASVLLGGIGTLLVVAAWTKIFPSLWRRETLGGK